MEVHGLKLWFSNFTMQHKHPGHFLKNYRAIHPEGPGPCRTNPGMLPGKDASSSEALDRVFFLFC